MLVLTRYPNERVIIDVPPSATPTKIEVVLVRIGSFNQARLGFEAPENVNFCRSEINGLLPVVEKPTTSIGQISPNGLVNAIRDAVPKPDECDSDPDPEYMLPMQKVAYYSSEARRRNSDYED